MFNDPMREFDGFPDSDTFEDIDKKIGAIEKQKQKYYRTRFIGQTLRFVLRPKVTFKDEDEVRKQIEEGRVFGLVSDHKNLMNPFATVAAVYKYRSLRGLQESKRSARRAGHAEEPRHTRPMSKIDLFRKSDKVGRFARHLLAIVGAAPVVRQQDSITDKGDYARDRIKDVMVKWMVRGISNLSFPSGTRSDDFNPDEAKKGMSRIATRSALEISAKQAEQHEKGEESGDEFIPTGASMLPFAITGVLRPRLRFGDPIRVEPGDEVAESDAGQESFVQELHAKTMAGIKESREYLAETA